MSDSFSEALDNAESAADFATALTPLWPSSRKRATDRVMSVEAETESPAQRQDRRWAQLMARAQDGDRAAYALLLHDCAPLIRRVASRQGVRGDTLDDVVQDVLMTVHRVRATYDPSRSFASWIATIAQRRAIDHLRRAGRRESREVYAPIAYEAHPDPSVDLATQSEWRENASVLASFVETLPSGQRQAVEQLAMRELSLEEASQATGRSKTALKVNLHRAIKSLRARMTGRE